MEFEWDAKKNRSNFGKHGVDFNEAKTVWADQHAVEYYDMLHSLGEDRYIRMGYSVRQRLLTVVFTESIENSIRLISARLTTLKERKRYEKGI